MSEPYVTGIAAANHIHANNYNHTFARVDRARRPIVTEAAAGPSVRTQIIRILSRVQWKFKFFRGESGTNGLAHFSFQMPMLKVGYFL